MTTRDLNNCLGAVAAATLLATTVVAQPQLGHHPATAEAARRYFESLHDRTPAPRLWVPTRATACPCTCPEPAKPVSANERLNQWMHVHTHAVPARRAGFNPWPEFEPIHTRLQ